MSVDKASSEKTFLEEPVESPRPEASRATARRHKRRIWYLDAETDDENIDEVLANATN